MVQKQKTFLVITQKLFHLELRAFHRLCITLICNSYPIDLEAMHAFRMQITSRLKQARQKETTKTTDKSALPKVGDAVLFRNHNKTSFTPRFLPGYRIVRKIDDKNYVIQHSINGHHSQVHIKDLIVSPMIRQVLDTFPPEETFGRVGKYANCPKVALRD